MLMMDMPRSKRSKRNAIQYRFVANEVESKLQVGKANRLIKLLYDQTGTSTALFMTGGRWAGRGCEGRASDYLIERLSQTLLGLTLHVYPGASFDPLGFYEPEVHYLALGLSEEYAWCLGSDFLQDSVLWASADAVPRAIHPLRAGMETDTTLLSSGRRLECRSTE